jgi:hypothetical protein
MPTLLWQAGDMFCNLEALHVDLRMNFVFKCKIFNFWSSKALVWIRIRIHQTGAEPDLFYGFEQLLLICLNG